MTIANSVRWPTEERPRGHLEEEKAVILDIHPRMTVHAHRTGQIQGAHTHMRCKLRGQRPALLAGHGKVILCCLSVKIQGGRRGGTNHLPCNTNFMSRFLGEGQQNAVALQSV